MTDKVYIPDVPVHEIVAMYKHIKPVITVEGEQFYTQKFSFAELFSIAYTWVAKPEKRAKKLKPLRDIVTYHKWGHYVLFKPSIAEVLAQIPPTEIGNVVAFEIIDSPNVDVVNGGYHRATTRLYIKGSKPS